MPIKAIQTEDDFRALLDESHAQRVVVYKHSSRCPVSAAVRRELEAFTNAHPEVPCGEVLVIEQRPLSLKIAEETGVTHQSPQAMVFEHGAVVWHASHMQVSRRHLEEACATEER